MKKSCLLLTATTCCLLVSPIVSASTPNVDCSTVCEKNIQSTVMNQLVEQGYLELDTTTHVVRITEKYKSSILNNTDLTRYNVHFTENSVQITSKFGTRSVEGETKIVYTWKGFDLYLNSEISSKISNAAWVASSLLGIIPDVTATKIIAAALGTVAGLIGYNNSKGRGVIIAFVGNIYSGAVPHWVTSQ